MDGTPTLRMNEFMLSSLHHNKIDHGADKPVRDLPAPTEVTFKLDAATNKYISEAETHFDELVGQHDMHVSSNLSGLLGVPTQKSIGAGPPL